MIKICERAVLRQIRMLPSNVLYVEKNPSNKIKQDYVASLLDYAKINFAFTARENFLSFYLVFISETHLMGPVNTNNILACIVSYSVRVLLRSRFIYAGKMD